MSAWIEMPAVVPFPVPPAPPAYFVDIVRIRNYKASQWVGSGFQGLIANLDSQLWGVFPQRGGCSGHASSWGVFAGNHSALPPKPSSV
jgi:hypothetical protein